MNDLRFEEKEKGMQTVVSIAGDIDAYHSPRLKEELEKYIKGDTAEIILDISEVPYIDSAGLGTLVSILRETRTHKKNLKLVGLRQNIKRIFEMTRLDKIFEIFDTVDESKKESKGE